MTAAKLIEILQAQDPETEIRIWFRDYWNDPKDRSLQTVRLKHAKVFLCAADEDPESAVFRILKGYFTGCPRSAQPPRTPRPE